MRARQTIHGESVVTAFTHLVARNRRRYGGYIVHAGIVMLFAAFAGMAFKLENDVTLKTGEAFETSDPYGHKWRFVSQGVSTSEPRDAQVIGVGLDAFRDGKRVGIIRSEKRAYHDAQGNPLFQPITAVGIRTTPGRTYTSCSPACGARTPRSCASRSIRSWCGCGPAAS